MAGQTLNSVQDAVFLITEPYTVAGKVVGMPKGAAVIYKRMKAEDPPPRAAIVASPTVGIRALEPWCSRDCAVGTAKLRGRPTLLASIYLDITKPAVPGWLEDIMQMADRRHMPLILAVDSNAHSHLYGPSSNTRGDQFEDFILRHGLDVENVGNAPTFETQRGACLVQTHIDVTLTRDLHFQIGDWRVDRSYNGSDHNTIRFSIVTENGPASYTRPWKKADWGNFTKDLRTADYKIPQEMSMKKLDRLLDRMYKILNSALDSACPLTEVKPKTSNHWATDKHAEGKRRVSDLYHIAKTMGGDAAWKNYREADRNFKKLCRKDRNQAWKKYKETIQSEREMASLARLAQREERREINVLTHPDGSTTDPGTETIALLTRTHFPAASSAAHVTYNNRRNAATTTIQNKYEDWINDLLIRRALDGFEKKKSPGPDGIKPLVFEHLPREFLHTLSIVYKAAIHLAYTPKAWKKTKVIFIAKPGKDSYDHPKAFRPISLSNYFLKGLERLVAWNMDKALIQFPIHHKQHGFLAGKSTESAISNTTDYIEKHIMKKQHCVGVFLDISSAFDSVKANHVRRALLEHGGNPEMVQWYYNYMSHRDIAIELHGESAIFSTGVGLPQGGVCSAKFWLIAFDTAIQIINRHKVEGNGYADDCSALSGGRRLDHAIGRLQKVLDSLSAWGKTCGLHFNPEKSVAVLFTRRRKVPPRPLYIDGKEIKYQQEVKYLGVTLDSKLYWNKHIDEKVEKAKKYLHQIAVLTRKNWGPKPRLMRWAYLGIVRPMLSYASMVWGHRAANKIEKLRRINRMAFNTFGSFPRSTPTAALEVMLDVMPLHLFCKQEGLASRIRLHQITNLLWDGYNNNKTHNASHLAYWQECTSTMDIDVANADACRIIRPPPTFKVNLDSLDGKARHRPLTEYNIFSDGSRQNDQTGLGYFICRQNKAEIASEHFRLPNHATVFQAELLAIKLACQTLLQLPDSHPRFVKIFSDSQAAIRALANHTTKSRTVSDTANALDELAAKARSVTLCWIPAHKGYFGNTKADDLAKMGAGSTDPRKLTQAYQSKASIKMQIKEAIYKEWGTLWSNSAGMKHSKEFYSGPHPGKAKFVYKLARLELGRFVRLITGHNNLNNFQTRIGLWHSKQCRFCQIDPETFIHLVHDCPCFWQQRADHFQGTYVNDDMKWSVRGLLDFSYIPAINQAFEGTWAHGDPADIDVPGLSENESESEQDPE